VRSNSFQTDCEMTLLLLAQTSTPHVDRVESDPVQLLPAWNKAIAQAVTENVLLGTSVILAYLENGRLERTVCLQTRLSAGENHYKLLRCCKQLLKKRQWEINKFSFIFPDEKCYDLCWRCGMFETSMDKPPRYNVDQAEDFVFKIKRITTHSGFDIWNKNDLKSVTGGIRLSNNTSTCPLFCEFASISS